MTHNRVHVFWLTKTVGRPFLSLFKVLVHINQLEIQYDRSTGWVYKKYGTLVIEIIDRDNKGSLQFWRRGHERVRHLVSQVTLHLIYQALIQPLFNYCNTVWRNCGITLRNKFQTLQNRAVRVLSFQTMMKTLVTWTPRVEKSIAPAWYWKSRDLQYEKRHITSGTLRISFAPITTQTNYYKNSFSYSGAILWNKLPCNVRQAESLNKFKRLGKQVL